MALKYFPDRIKTLTTTTGTGAVTLTSAAAQYQAGFAAMDGQVVDYILLDVNGTAWETGVGIYTQSGTTLTRGPVSSSNSGSAIALSATGSSVIIGPSAQNASDAYASQRGFLRGGQLSYASSTTIDCSAVCAFIESSNRVYDFAAPATLTITGGASTIMHVYLTTSGTIVDSATAPVLFATKAAGNARSKSGDTSQRYLGSYVTNASSQVLPFVMQDIGGGESTMFYTGSDHYAAPFRVLAAGAATTFTTQSLAAVLPANVCTQVYTGIGMKTTGAFPNGSAVFSLDGVNASATLTCYAAAAANPEAMLWMPVIPATPSVYYKTFDAANTVAIDVSGYRFVR